MKARRNHVLALLLTASVAISTIVPSAVVFAEDFDAAWTEEAVAFEEEIPSAIEAAEYFEEAVESAEEDVTVEITDDFGLDSAVDAQAVETVPAEGKIAYTGDEVGFYKEDGATAFGMWSSKEGSETTLEGDEVNIKIVPSNKTVYGWLHWGLITDAELTKDVAVQEDGTILLSVSKENCGYAIPIAPIKVKDGGTTKEQYYLCIPTEDKLTPAKDDQDNRIVYNGEEVGFYKEDGTSAFGMWSSKEGSVSTLEGDEVKIKIIPSNRTVYGWLHWGLITDTDLTKDVELKEDEEGKYIELSVSKENCGYGLPVAPIKVKDGGTTSTQYYLCIPAADKFVKDADYSAVEAALKKVPSDLSIYTDASAKAVRDAVAAVTRGKTEAEQAEVDAVAKAIETAVAVLTVKPGVTFTVSNLKYQVLSGSKTVAFAGASKKTVTSVSVPTSVKWNGTTYKVTAIAEKACYKYTVLKTVTVPKTVTSIGAKAFTGCTALTKVTISGSALKKVGNYAFYNCTALKSISLPTSLTTIGSKAFASCKALTKVTIKGTALKKIGASAFSKAGSNNYKKLTVVVPKSKLSAYKKLLQTAGLSKKATVKAA